MSPPPWEIPVLDAEFRKKTLKVAIIRGSVALIAPAGGVAFLSPESDDILCDAVRQARLITDQPQGGSR